MLFFKTTLLVLSAIAIILGAIILIAAGLKKKQNAKDKKLSKGWVPRQNNDCVNILFLLYVETKETRCTNIDSIDYRPFAPISAYTEISVN